MESPMPALIKKIILAVTSLSLLVTPALSLAVDRPANTAANFCTRIANVKTELNTKLATLETSRTAKRTEILNMLKARRDDRAAQIKTQRDEQKLKFEDNIEAIEDTATTSDEKAAVGAFKAAVEAAMIVRKTAVDAAQATFKTTLDSLVNSRQEAIRTAGATFKAAVALALAKAQTDCAANVDPVTVRTTLMNSIREASTKFHSDVQAVEQIGQQVKEAAATRNAAVKAANKAFKDTILKAKQDLKNVVAI